MLSFKGLKCCENSGLSLWQEFIVNAKNIVIARRNDEAIHAMRLLLLRFTPGSGSLARNGKFMPLIEYVYRRFAFG